jgi:hypothetical protein
MSVRRVGALLFALCAQACAQQDGPTPSVVKPSWVVARAWCPAGCSAATEGVLKAQVGQPVQLSATTLVAPFVDPCEGQVHLALKSVAPAAIVADVNKGVAPGHRRLAASDLGVAGDAVSGWALCKGAAVDVNLQRLLVVAPDRVLLLSEEQSLIELR